MFTLYYDIDIPRMYPGMFDGDTLNLVAISNKYQRRYDFTKRKPNRKERRELGIGVNQDYNKDHYIETLDSALFK